MFGKGYYDIKMATLPNKGILMSQMSKLCLQPFHKNGNYDLNDILNEYIRVPDPWAKLPK